MQISNLPASNSFSSTDVLPIEINGVTYKVTGATLAAALQTLGNYLTPDNVANNLTTTAAGSVLDARQGKVLAEAIGIVETGSTCTHTGGIAAGQYVIWQGVLYTADSAISVGETLAASGGSKNLTACPDGGLNKVNDSITTVANKFKIIEAFTADSITAFLKQILDYGIALGAGNYVLGIAWQYHYFCNINISVQSSTRCVASVFPQPANVSECFVCDRNNNSYTYKKFALTNV